MGSDFRINTLARVALIALSALALAYSLLRTGWMITPLLLALLLCLQCAALIAYVEKTNRAFADFLLAVKSNDFSRVAETDGRGASFAAFRKAQNTLAAAFQQAREERDASHAFLQMVIADLQTALIAFDRDGAVKLMNGAARSLLHTPYLHNINTLKTTIPELYDYLQTLQPEGNALLELELDGERLKLSGRAVTLVLRDIPHKLVSIQDITPELQATEAEAWEQLLRVLTHEIMNSLTPVSSLAATLEQRAARMLAAQPEDSGLDDLSAGLRVIGRRSEGLIRFVHRYRSLVNIPAPDIRLINVASLFGQIAQLQEARLKEQGIRLQRKVPADPVYIRADAGQIEQVLLNLVNNAADALGDSTDPVILLEVMPVSGKVLIRVTDNGTGIEQRITDNLFVPFFTTKSNGSGIGLSLSRQLLRKNGGTITIRSVPQETVCTLSFPQLA